MSVAPKPLSWLGVIRLGLVQTALGAIVVLTTSTLNRVMVVEFALPAMLPAALVGWHYAVQLSRPKWGHGSDLGARRTPFIIGGMAALALGGALAAYAATLAAAQPFLGVALGIAAFTLIGAGVGASGTSLLALLATAAAPARRPAAAAIVWIMMILGFVITAGIVGANLDPFSAERLIAVSCAVSLAAFCLAVVAVWGVEEARPPVARPATPPQSFARAIRDVWDDPKARIFTIFVFVSMLAYSAQDLILEPFAGLVFGMTPGQSTQLAGMQHGGVLLGMILFGIVGGMRGGHRVEGVRIWTAAGCLGSAGALAALAAGASVGPGFPLAVAVFALGFFNGVFAVSAIGAMMSLAGEGGGGREGTRMGLWGAAQAIAFGLGGFLGAAGVDGLRALLPGDAPAFLIVFALEAALFIAAAAIAWRIAAPEGQPRLPALPAEIAAE